MTSPGLERCELPERMSFYDRKDAELRDDGMRLRLFLALPVAMQRWISHCVGEGSDFNEALAEHVERQDLIFCWCCYEAKPKKGAGFDPTVDRWICQECCDEYAD